MYASFVSALQLYKDEFWRIFVISLTILLPIQLIYTVVVNFISLPFYYTGIPIWPTIFQAFFILMSLFVMQLPLISMVRQEALHEEVKLPRAYGETVQQGFFAYASSIPYAFFVVIGLLLFVVPGLILLILFTGIPFAKIMEGGRFTTILKKAYRFGKENFLHLLGLLALFTLIDFAISYLLTAAVIYFVGQFAVFNWAMMIVNMLLFPIYVFSVSYLYKEWKGEEMAGVEESIALT